MWYDYIMRKHKGFTIIEVVLVLAVAGLIFAMVFMALPALWASQRDTARRESVLSFVRTLKSFQTNNSRGALPGFRNSTEENNAQKGNAVLIYGDNAIAERNYAAEQKKKNESTWTGFYRDYFGDEYQDPNGAAYNWAVMYCVAGSKMAGSTCTNSDLETMYNSTFESNNYTMRIVISATCDGDHAVLSANNRRAAVLYHLEGSGVYCENI